MNTTAGISGPNGTAKSSFVTPVAGSSISVSPGTAAVIVAVIVPIVVIAIGVLSFFQIQKHWKMRRAQATVAATLGAKNERVDPSENVQLYLQNKAELSVERTGRGMRLEEDIYEMMDHDTCQEMPGEESRQPMLSLGERHELRGEDHARELDGSQDHQKSQQESHRYSFDLPDFFNFNESVLSLHEFA